MSTNNESPAALLPMDGDKEVELLLRVSKHHRLPGYLIHALESGADAIRRLQVALASQIDISNAERELTRRLSTAPGASESRGGVPDGDDAPMVKLAAVLQALEFEPAAVNHSAAVLSVICRAVAKQAKRAAVPTPPAVSNGEPPKRMRIIQRDGTSRVLPYDPRFVLDHDEMMEVIDEATTLARSNGELPDWAIAKAFWEIHNDVDLVGIDASAFAKVAIDKARELARSAAAKVEG